jgi:hypothetical protein
MREFIRKPGIIGIQEGENIGSRSSYSQIKGAAKTVVSQIRVSENAYPVRIVARVFLCNIA